MLKCTLQWISVQMKCGLAGNSRRDASGVWGLLILLQINHGSRYFELPRWLSHKESTCNAGNEGSIPGSGRFPGGGNGNPLIFLLGKLHGQRSLAGHRPCDSKRVEHDLATKQQLDILLFSHVFCKESSDEAVIWKFLKKSAYCLKGLLRGLSSLGAQITINSSIYYRRSHINSYRWLHLRHFPPILQSRNSLWPRLGLASVPSPRRISGLTEYAQWCSPYDSADTN